MSKYDKKAMMFGTFDIIHPGHINLIIQAKKISNNIIVVIARDINVNKIKNRLPINNENVRLENVKELSLANKVILGDTNDVYKVIKIHRPEIIFLGYDQIEFTNNLKQRLDNFGLHGTEIIRLKSFGPKIYKTSKIISKLCINQSAPLSGMKRTEF